MNCDEATDLLSARIDGELAAGDSAALDAHLAECSACRQTLAELEHQDAALLRAFSPSHDIAMNLADRVARTIAQESAPPAGSSAHRVPAKGKLIPFLLRLGGPLIGVAAGFVAAIVFLKPSHRPIPIVPAEAAHHVARLTLATGAVFTCPADQGNWQPISTGATIDRGAAVRTADTAKCELRLSNGCAVRLNCGTEARFVGDRNLQVSAGQLWSAVPRGAAPICVTAGQTIVTARGGSDDASTRFDLRCVEHAANVTVECGAADVDGNGPRTTIHGGQILHAADSSAGYSCTALPDPLRAMRWQDDLLALKPGDDPEVIARVRQLLAKISTESAAVAAIGTTEQDLRAHGREWSSSMVCILRNSRDCDQTNRRTASRILQDVATSANIPDLIALLEDPESDVRFHAASALHRLTGQTLGCPPDRWISAPEPGMIASWRKWWEQQQSHEPAEKPPEIHGKV